MTDQEAYDKCDFEYTEAVAIDYSRAVVQLEAHPVEPLRFLYKTHPFRCMVQDAMGMTFPVDAGLLRRA